MSANNFDFEERNYCDNSNRDLDEFRDKLLSFIEKEEEDARALFFSENGMSINGNRDDRFKALGKTEILLKLIKWLKDN